MSESQSLSAALPPLPSLVPPTVPRLVKFDKPLSSTNWLHWKSRTRDALQILQVWDHVESDLSATRPDPLVDTRVTAAYLAMWDNLDRIAWAQIHHNISDINRTITSKCTTARAAWVALIANFVQASVTSRMAILAEIHDYSFEPESTVLSHTNRLRSLSDQLMESGGTMPEDQLVMHLLTSMPEEYDQTVVFLRMQPPATLTLDYVSNALMAAETISVTKKNKATAHSYLTQTNKSKGGFGQPSSKPSGGRKPKHQSGPVCSLCDRPGHARENCFQDPKVGYPD